MSGENIVKGRVLRRVLNRITDLISGALTLDNYTIGLARDDDTMVARDDVGGFHYFPGLTALNALVVDLSYARAPVNTQAQLPPGDPNGAIRLVISEGLFYSKSAGVWSILTSSLMLGETSTTAYRGDRGKTAYDHSQATGNPHGTTIANISGLQTALDGKEALHTRSDITAATDFHTLNDGIYRISGGTWHANNPGNPVYNWGVLEVKSRNSTHKILEYVPDVLPSSSSSSVWISASFGGTWRGWSQLPSKAYMDTIYAILGGTPTFLSVIAQETVQANEFYTDGLATFGSTAIQGICEMRANVSMGTQVSTSDSGGEIPSNVTGFINRATFTANRTRVLPYPAQGKILFVSNAGSSTGYDLILTPPNGVTIQYGISQLALKGGNAAGLKSIVLCGATDTLWVVLSTYNL